MNPDMFRFTSRPQTEKSSLVVGWTRDTGNVSGGTAEYVVNASDADSFCQIEPEVRNGQVMLNVRPARLLPPLEF